MAGSEVDIPVIDDALKPIERIAPWAVNDVIADAYTAAVELKAASTRANAAHYLTHLTLSNRVALADQAITILDDDDNIYFGPIVLMVVGDGVFSKDFKDPIKFPDNKGIFVKESVGGKASALTVYIEGYTGDVPLG